MLSKLKMPEKKKPKLDELDMAGMEESGEEAPYEDAEEEGAEADPDMQEGMAELDMVSDEDLLAELKKRGLMSGMGMGPEEEEEDGFASAAPPYSR